MTTPTPDKAARWRFIAITSLVALALVGALLAAGVFLARQSLSTHYNLYYVMWKAGLRPYDSLIARSGMFHDHGFRSALLGISEDEFERRFPSTFYKIQSAPQSAKPNQTYYTDNYHQSRPGAHFYGPSWIAIFEDGRLISIEYDKGV
jgi:hypothetical protein